MFEIETKELKVRDELNRKIDNCFNKIANDNKHDLAVEIIIEHGDMHYWKDNSKEDKYKMVDVFKNKIRRKRKFINSIKKYNR